MRWEPLEGMDDTEPGEEETPRAAKDVEGEGGRGTRTVSLNWSAM